MKKTLLQFRWIHITVGTPKFFVGVFFAALAAFGCCAAGAPVHNAIFLPICLLAISVVEIKTERIGTVILNCLWAAFAPVVTFVFMQLMMGVGFHVSSFKMLLGILCAAAVYLLLFICTFRLRISVLVGMALFLLLTVINYYVLKFRGSELTPVDFLSVGTAMNMAGEYDYSVDITFVYACVIAAIYSLSVFCIPVYAPKRTVKKTALCFATGAVIIGFLAVQLPSVKAGYYTNKGSMGNGFLLNFVRQFETISVKTPEGYSVDGIRDLEEEYDRNSESSNTPDVFVIMCETFSDLRVIGDLRTDKEVMPFLDSLTENTVRGYAFSSVFAGGTCNSEYEVLTGNSMAFHPSVAYPYQQYIRRNTYSMASYLKSLGYSTMATHPNVGTNWMRSTAWPLLGFDEERYLKDYPQEDLPRGFVSDMEMYQQLISWYEQRDKEVPFFCFGTTMQNHSPYDNEAFPAAVHLQGYSREYPDVEQYLTLLNYSDQALQYLIEYFSAVDNEVVLLFFGDHQADIDEEFLQELNGGSFDTLEEQMKQYTVPFVVWANFDIEEKVVEQTSLNYLSSYVYEVAGIRLPAYNAFLQDVSEEIPMINAFGYYSKQYGRFVALEEAAGTEKEWLDKYRILQYNSLFDSDNRSKVFFGST